MAIQPLEDLAICDGRTVAEALVDRSVEQPIWVDLGGRTFENLPREIGCDARFLKSPEHAQATVPTRDELMPGDRSRSPFVVERTLAHETSDGGVDVVGRVAASSQPVPELRFGQFAPGEKREGRGVAGADTIVQTW